MTTSGSASNLVLRKGSNIGSDLFRTVHALDDSAEDAFIG